MKFVTEDLFIWKPNTMFIVPTNGSIDVFARMVMNSGAALELKTRIPDLPKGAAHMMRMLGRRVELLQTSPEPFDYGNDEVYWANGHYTFYLLIYQEAEPKKAGAGLFQMSNLYKDDPDKEIIQISANHLNHYATRHPRVNIRLAYPGAVDGEVTIILKSSLSADNITVCN